jgi:hypothetical protein
LFRLVWVLYLFTQNKETEIKTGGNKMKKVLGLALAVIILAMGIRVDAKNTSTTDTVTLSATLSAQK